MFIFRFVLLGGLGLSAAFPALVASAETAVPAGHSVTVALEKHSAGTFYMDGEIRGYGSLRMLVDTGSSFLVINQVLLDTIEAAGEAEYSHELSGLMADGSRRVIPVYRISALRLGEACWVHDVEAAVFPGTVRPILGMNILAQLAPFTFSAAPAQLALNRCEQMEPPGTAVTTSGAPAPGRVAAQ